MAWVSSLAGRNDLPLLRAGDLAEPILADAAGAVVATVAERHATFGRMNLLAEAHRVLHGVRFASPEDRVAVAEHITDLAAARSVALTPPAIHHTPAAYLRADRSSRLRAREPHRLHDRGPSRRGSTPARGRQKGGGTPGEHGDGGEAHRDEPARPRLRAEHSTRRSPSRRSPPPGGSSTCSSARPAPASRPPWRDCEPRGRPSTGPGR